MQGYKPGSSGRCACDPALSPNCLACVTPGTCGPTSDQSIGGEQRGPVIGISDGYTRLEVT